jgi:hypothetical protein
VRGENSLVVILYRVLEIEFALFARTRFAGKVTGKSANCSLGLKLFPNCDT